MGMAPTTGKTADNARAKFLSRSPQSHDFEQFWDGLRKGSDLVPRRDDFNPARAARFIRELVLMEAPAPDRKHMRIRIAGERYQEIAGQNLSGKDHLDFLDPDFHDGALTTGWLMSTQPCGLWQIMQSSRTGGWSKRKGPRFSAWQVRQVSVTFTPESSAGPAEP